jgi:hypothetical protein
LERVDGADQVSPQITGWSLTIPQLLKCRVELFCRVRKFSASHISSEFNSSVMLSYLLSGTGKIDSGFRSATRYAPAIQYRRIPGNRCKNQCNA